MLTESQRHQDILARLTICRVDLEKQWFKIDTETPVVLIDIMLFQQRCLDVMLSRMVGRARLISPEMEEITHRALTMVTALLNMERAAYAPVAEGVA